MSLDTAQKVVNFMFDNTPPDEKLDIGFFGGEPLLEFELIKEITHMIKNHKRYSEFSSQLSLVTNGTIFSDEIAYFLNQHNIGFCLSCDGPPILHNAERRFKGGEGSATIVTNTIKQALDTLPVVLVNAVYSPHTLTSLPQIVDYFTSLGLRRIYLNPNFSANWTTKDSDGIIDVYSQIALRYIKSYEQNKPLFISLLDSKIAVILRGGYQVEERCHMGRKEFAFTAEGNIFPCERLVGDGSIENQHCIGHVDTGVTISKFTCNNKSNSEPNKECITCSLRNFCMNWCGCSNYFSTGNYNQVGPFLCSSERAAIQVALDTFQFLDQKIGVTFFEHIAGRTALNSAMA